MSTLAPEKHLGKASYAQSGEDLIARFILDVLSIPCPNYLDLGAYDAVQLSNTYHFYEQGSTGVCVEADPELVSRIIGQRPKDRILNVAVSGLDKGTRDFFLMSSPTLNTLSRAEAHRLEREEACPIRAVTTVDVVPVSEIVATHFPERSLDFLSIDVEGGDADIIAGFDFDFARPKVICVETLSYSRTGLQTKSSSAAEILSAKGYMLYADTYINTIFVDSAAWSRRG
ncbi:FkbM family methyltransferase [Bosea sp. 2RAB26]|uniref:FkbM family methyltransferase n=1 Tax=Bosea sp. 2RAB26 TaxID=3237476 RepID=UPI003F911CC2